MSTHAGPRAKQTYRAFRRPEMIIRAKAARKVRAIRDSAGRTPPPLWRWVRSVPRD